MVIYLKNKAGGTKVATMELEAQYDEQHGWVRYNPNAVKPIVIPKPIVKPKE